MLNNEKLKQTLIAWNFLDFSPSFIFLVFQPHKPSNCSMKPDRSFVGFCIKCLHLSIFEIVEVPIPSITLIAFPTLVSRCEHNFIYAYRSFQLLFLIVYLVSSLASTLIFYFYLSSIDVTRLYIHFFIDAIDLTQLSVADITSKNLFLSKFKLSVFIFIEPIFFITLVNCLAFIVCAFLVASSSFFIHHPHDCHRNKAIKMEKNDAK